MLTILLLVATCHAAGPLPDSSCTPGATDPHVTQDNVQTTICLPGYTKTVRPAVSVTSKIKRERMAAYGFKGAPLRYELDHLISLELGGAPADVANLWPEAYLPKPGAHEKDECENLAHKAICSGQMTLAEAQKEIATDWLAVYKRLPKKHVPVKRAKH